MAQEQGGTVTLSEAELAEVIDREAKVRLKMSGVEFTRRFLAGKLENTSAVRDIAMLVRIGQSEDGKTISSRVRGLPERYSKQNRNGKSPRASR